MTLKTPMTHHKPIVLVADDQETNRRLLRRFLRDLNYSIVEARDGFEAICAMKTGDPDIVLLDLEMPKMDGFQVLEESKKDIKIGGRIPIIVISGLADMDNIVKSIRMGAEDFLPKPFDVLLLKTRLESCLEKKRLHEMEVLYLERIQKEKKISDELLHIILPDPIIRELKMTNEVIPRRYEDVAVLFCDIVGFTAYCQKHTPEEVLRRLDNVVLAFEEVSLHHRIHKLKTIGDSFMAISGLFEKSNNSALDAVKCALEMLSAGQRIQPDWGLRIGIHSGPVIAGILGRKRYQFDVWGDTVNTAARIESNGNNNAINVSKQVWEKVSDSCQGHTLGPIELKGKGKIEIFVVQKLKDQELMAASSDQSFSTRTS